MDNRLGDEQWIQLSKMWHVIFIRTELPSKGCLHHPPLSGFSSLLQSGQFGDFFLCIQHHRYLVNEQTWRTGEFCFVEISNNWLVLGMQCNQHNSLTFTNLFNFNEIFHFCNLFVCGRQQTHWQLQSKMVWSQNVFLVAGFVVMRRHLWNLSQFIFNCMILCMYLFIEMEK